MSACYSANKWPMKISNRALWDKAKQKQFNYRSEKGNGDGLGILYRNQIMT
jgi:hypothetical protein